MIRNAFTRRRASALAVLAGGALAVTLLQPSTPAAGDDTLPYQDPSLSTSRRVSDLLGRMTLAEKIGQMTQAERVDVDADTSLITSNALGSVLSGGGSVPSPNTAEAWADMVDRYQQAALDTRLGIPLIYGVDSVHGHGNLQGATVFPHNIGLGATRDPKLVQKIGHIVAEETRASGPQWAFAPCICVARDDRWGRTYESFGETPRLVKSMETFIDGLQGKPGQLDNADRVLASAKHFAGDGLTSYDEAAAGTGAYPIDQGIDKVSRKEFKKLALSPYVPAIKQHHVGSVMPSFSSVDWTDDGLGNPVKMHANKQLITGWLKNQQHFQGFVISDWRAIRQLPGDYRAQVKASVLAGVDMYMEPIQAPNNPTGWDEFIPTLTDLVGDGEVPVARIDDAVSRILRAKFELGLFEHPLTDRSNLDQVGSKAHRAVARRAVAESQVLLRNKQRTLPLQAKSKVYVAGSNADNIGNQAGGWTLTWQGGSTNVIPGQTILGGIEKAAKGSVVYSEKASDPGAAQLGRCGGRGRDAVRRGLRRRRWAAVGLRPRRRRGAAPEADDGDQRCRQAGDPHGLRPDDGLHGAGRLRSAADHPAGPAHPDRRAGRVVAAGQPGRRRRGRALRPQPVRRQAAGDLAAHARAGADQRRRRVVQPALQVRVRAQRRPLSHLAGPCPGRTGPDR